MKRSILLLSLVFLTGCSTTRCGSDYGFLPRSFGGASATCHDSGCRMRTGYGWIDACSCAGIDCLCTDKFKTKCAAKHLANKHMPDGCCSDFEDGFRQAFVDVSMGACGQVPAVAPKKYWKYCDRTSKGHTSAQSWFGGYQSGAQIALGFQDRFLDIAVSHQCGYQQLPPHQYSTGY